MTCTPSTQTFSRWRHGDAGICLDGRTHLSPHSHESAVIPRPLIANEAGAVVELWLDQPPSVVVERTPRHLGLLRGLLVETGTAANLVNDAHVAASAVDFQRFQGVRSSLP